MLFSVVVTIFVSAGEVGVKVHIQRDYCLSERVCGTLERVGESLEKKLVFREAGGKFGKEVGLPEKVCVNPQKRTINP